MGIAALVIGVFLAGVALGGQVTARAYRDRLHLAERRYHEFAARILTPDAVAQQED